MKSVLQNDVRADLLRRVHSLTPQATPRWGRMSADQMVVHVADVYRISLGERATAFVGNFLWRTVVKYVFLYSPLRMIHGRPAPREVNQEHAGTSPRVFAEDVQTLTAMTERFASDAHLPSPEHPYFGHFTRWQWARFHYKHMDHHLRQFGA